MKNILDEKIGKEILDTDGRVVLAFAIFEIVQLPELKI